jgi:isoleucyl-tRNA synthetase
MSKRYKNYPNPDEVLVKYGADALRLYLLDSPVTHSEPLKFQEDGIQQKAKFLVQLYNCFQFLDSEIRLLLHKKNLTKFTLKESSQVYDQWILGKLKEVSDKAIQHYSEYKLYLVVPLLIEFEELFSKWYINLAKNNIKGSNGEESLSALWKVLYNYSILISPITPFMSDKIYTNLRELVNLDTFKESVHMELLETSVKQLTSDPVITRKVNAMVDVVMSVRGLKATAGIGVRMKSKELVLKHTSQQFLDDVKELEKELLTTVRIDKVTYQLLALDKEDGQNNDLIVKINSSPVLGRQLKKDLMPVLDTIRKMSPFELLGKDKIQIMGYDIPSETWSILPQENKDQNLLVDYTSKGLLIQLTKEVITTPIEDSLELMIKGIQKAKKDAELKPYQIVDVYVTINNLESEFYNLFVEEFDNIKDRLRSNVYLNDNDKHKKLDEFIKVIQSTTCDQYSYEIWI